MQMSLLSLSYTFEFLNNNLKNNKVGNIYNWDLYVYELRK